MVFNNFVPGNKVGIRSGQGTLITVNLSDIFLLDAAMCVFALMRAVNKLVANVHGKTNLQLRA